MSAAQESQHSHLFMETHTDTMLDINTNTQSTSFSRLDVVVPDLGQLPTNETCMLTLIGDWS
jgi:hypothetical protein